MKKISLVTILILLVSGCSQEDLLNNHFTSYKGKLFTVAFEQNVSSKMVTFYVGQKVTVYHCLMVTH